MRLLLRQGSNVKISHSLMRLVLYLCFFIYTHCDACDIQIESLLRSKMLVSFSVANFLSFEEKQTLSLNAGLVRKKSERIYRDKAGNRLVKFAALFGANASGKSNLVEAIGFSKSMIIHGFPSESTKMYCRRDEESRKRPQNLNMRYS